jgi:hypothetical protein
MFMRHTPRDFHQWSDGARFAEIDRASRRIA